MAIPPEAPHTISELVKAIDWTWVMTVLIVVVGGIVALLKIFAGTVSENKLRKSELVKEIQKKSSSHDEELVELRKMLSEAQSDLRVQKVEVENSKKTEAEIKRDYRELVNRMDDLIRQVIDLMS